MSEEVKSENEGVHIDVAVTRYEGTAFEVAQRPFEDHLGYPLSNARSGR